MNVLFFVHGIGRHGTGWSGDPVAALQNAMRLYPDCFPAGTTLAEHVKPIEIKYDDLFDTVLDRWAQLAAALPAPAGAFNWASKVSQILQDANDNRNVFARYGGDVLLYCGFALVARAVRLRLNALIASTIYEEHAAAHDRGDSPPKFGVIAHSLGTAVVQDALYQLATGQWIADQNSLVADLQAFASRTTLTAGQKTELVADLGSAGAAPPGTLSVDIDGLFLISDTSPLLHQSPFYSELQRDGVYDCQAVWSVNHEFDPVSIVGAAGGGGPWRPDKKTVTVRHFHRKNIHDLAHYLSHPAVHGPIFQLLIPAFRLACYQRSRALADEALWSGFGGELATLPQQARDQLKAKLLRAVDAERNVQKLRDAIEKYFRAIGLLQ